MLVNTLFSSALMASAAIAHSIGARSPTGRCGAPLPSNGQRAVAKHFAEKEAAAKENGRVAVAPINVPVYMHVVSTSTSSADGYLDDATLQKQLDVMNADYAPSQISFSLKKVTRTVNSNWAQDKSEMDMKKALRQGGYNALNLYYMTYLSGYLGYCYFPEDTTNGSTTFIRDGCSILAGTAPGGPEEGYNLGKTTTHEVGHWFGLYHTFEGGCTGNGDFVSDTPSQASESSGCPTGRDSCPSQAGLDPIHNYMDYSDDACYEEFTSGQMDRIRSYWNNYRA
ncbi:Fc.00g078310.m01.CDS01 [Cosmosporella sp. VM-42]